MKNNSLRSRKNIFCQCVEKTHSKLCKYNKSFGKFFYLKKAIKNLIVNIIYRAIAKIIKMTDMHQKVLQTLKNNRKNNTQE